MKSSTGDVQRCASRRLWGRPSGELAGSLGGGAGPRVALKPYFSRTLSTASPSATSRQPSSMVSWKALWVRPLTLTPTRRTQRAPTSSSSSSAVAVS